MEATQRSEAILNRASTFLSSLSKPRGFFSYLGIALTFGFSIYSVWKYKQLPLGVLGSLVTKGFGIWSSPSPSQGGGGGGPVINIPPTPVSVNIDFKSPSTLPSVPVPGEPNVGLTQFLNSYFSNNPTYLLISAYIPPFIMLARKFIFKK